MLDLRIDDGVIVDGTGAPRRAGSIGIRDGRIVTVGQITEPAHQVIDASGRVVAPGFIDVHTHYDAQAFWDGTLSPSCYHGVTTVIGGNCGFSIAPLSGRKADGEYLMHMLSRVEGMPVESLQTGVPWDWTSFGDYLDRLDGTLAINAGFMVGHSALRRTVMGERAVGHKATTEDLAAMKELLRRSLTEGGLGFSSTLSATHNDANGQPVPSRHASDAELMGLAAVLRDFPGTNIEFLPAVGRFTDADIERMTNLSLASQRPVNWNVLVANSATKEMQERQLSASDHAAQRGGKVVALVTARTIGLRLNLRSGFIFDALPNWADVIALPVEERKTALRDPAVRAQLDCSKDRSKAGILGIYADWSSYTVGEGFCAATKPYEGRTIGAIAAAEGKEPFDVFLDLALADDLLTSFVPRGFAEDEESWRLRGEMWKDKRTVIGASDAGAHLDMIDTFAYSSHVLSLGVRDRNLLSLEEAVQQLTQVPAALIGLKDRGEIRPGYWADLVLFDPATIGSGPIYTRFDLPGGAGRLYADAEGVGHVIVNGTEIIRDNELIDPKRGRILRSGWDTFTASLN